MARRVVGFALAAALLVALAAGVALADRAAQAVVNCRSVPCFASGQSDIVNERVGNGKRDDIRLSGGDDLVRADRYGNDRDRVSGGPGYDRIYVNDGDIRDRANAGTRQGGNWCFVDSRREAGPGCTRVTVGNP